jgi:hypothetical protein
MILKLMKRILITRIVHGLFKKVVFLGSRFILKKLLIHAHFMPARVFWHLICWGLSFAIFPFVVLRI